MKRRARLDAALERGELRLDYLPIVGLNTGEVVGVEALLRWDPGTGPVLSPTSFLAEAERSGALVEVGRWVLETALTEVASIGRPEDDPLRLSVNVSYRELVNPDLPRVIEEALHRTGHRPEALWLEISEATLAHDTPAVTRALYRLRDVGARLSIDDFGTGTASLSLLQSLPVDELKIDRSFVARMHDDPRSAAIARAVVSLARSLELQTMAEGVELSTQERMLVGLRCSTAQGWLYARPASSIEAAIAAVDPTAIRGRTHEEPAALWSGFASPRAAAQLVEDAFEHAPIGMALIDGAGTHLAVNPALGDLLGIPQADLVGQSCWDAVHPDDLRLDQARLDAVLRGELPGYSLEERYVDTAGSSMWVEVIVSGLPDGSPTAGPPRLLRQVRCIEDRRQAEAHRHELERLNLRLSEQAEFLADANERLASFASTLSHDLNQPLVALGGFLDLLITHRADKLDADGAVWLTAANRAAHNLRDAVDALRANAESAPVQLTAVDLGEVFGETLTDLAPQLQEAEANVDLGPLPTVLGDRAMLGRVAANLITNACRYRDETRPLQLTIHTTDATDDQTVIVVADNGLGIAPDELTTVFTPGHRGTAAAGLPGTGTGLAIVRSVINHLGGRVWAETGTSPGARICLALPPYQPTPAEEPPTSHDRVKVALIDDSADVRAVLTAVLEADGMVVVAEADDAATAHRVVGQAAPDVIILDQMLGDDTGIPLIPALKADDALVIVMSGTMTLEMQQAAINTGADAAIAKANLLQLGDLIDGLMLQRHQ